MGGTGGRAVIARGKGFLDAASDAPLLPPVIDEDPDHEQDAGDDEA